MTSEEKNRALQALEWVFRLADSHGKYTCSEQYELVKSALRSVEAEKEPEWISCEDRLPGEDDADFEGKVFAHCKDGYWLHTCHWETVRAHCKRENFTHWMPTGLKLPAPPEHKPE